ncbi:MAG: DUF2723 domain-containing protein [Chloroflexi bacterium]|nr:DUF2723 domain-containing protein [Chloroflexota bacterium]
MNSHSAIRHSPFAILELFWPSLAAGALALALYARTLAPGLTWAHSGSDGGDLLAAALTGGVPHPPGYPTYQLLLRAVLALVPGDPARTGNWLSAVCAALAVALLADLARRTLPEQPWRGVVAMVAALTWAASPTLWGQAVITEVYALNALIVVALLWLAWRWRAAVQSGRTGTAWLVSTSLLLGLGLGNHLSLVWMLPGTAAWLWSNRVSMGRTPVLGWIAVGAAGLAGLSVYAYLPLVSVGAPPINWGDPHTPVQFWWLISGRAYGALPFGIELAYLPGRLAAWVADALRQFGGPWSALIALAGLWRIDQRDHTWWRLTGLIALAFSVYAIGYNTADSFVYLIPVWAVAALWLAAGMDWGVGIADGRLQMVDGRWQMAERETKNEKRKTQEVIGDTQHAARSTQHVTRSTQHAARSTQHVTRSTQHALLVLALIVLPGVSLIRFWGEMDLSRDHEARDYVAGVLSEAAPDAVILTASDGPTFALWYARYGLGQRPDLIPINVNLYVFPWYRETLRSAHPSLAETAGTSALPSLDRLVARLMLQRPLYRGEPLNVTFADTVERPAGALVQMMVSQ